MAALIEHLLESAGVLGSSAVGVTVLNATMAFPVELLVALLLKLLETLLDTLLEVLAWTIDTVTLLPAVWLF